MSRRSDKRYYIKRQTNAGPNQGKWRVHAPDGRSVSPACDRKAQAVLLCAAFELARQHPTFGDLLPYEQNFRAESGGKDGPLRVLTARGCVFLDY